MKICVINNIYPPYHRGGAEQVVVTMVEGLLAQGHEVVIITGTPGQEATERHERLTIYRLRPHNLFFYTHAEGHTIFERALWHVIDMFHLSVANKVQEILEAEHVDLVHTHNLMGLSFLIPRVIRKLRIHHVHTVHDVQLVEPSAMILKEKEQSWRYTGLPTKLYTGTMKRLMGSPHVVISPSQFLLDFYRSRGFFEHSHQVVLRNPVTFSFQETRQVVDEPHDSFRFLYIGQIERHKGLFLLLSAFQKLHIQFPHAELHIVGSGSVLEEIRASVVPENGVYIYGRLKREELPALFAKMDMAVVPSLCYENSPTVIFESLSCGRPVLASDIEGVAELIREGENGITFETGNVEKLVEKMQWCLTHKETVQKMSGETRQSLVGLSRDEYVQRLEKLYQR